MPSGILLLDKPRGLSSNAALQRVRRLLGGIKAGHAGSLDPLATGMLPICLGEATKIVGDIVSGEKRYRFTVSLGARTASGDTEGEITARAAVPPLTPTEVEEVLRGFLGTQTQVPPMHSALKVDGRPLYALARAGLTVDRAPRTIELQELRLLTLGPESLEIEARCSKGTYIRVLGEDIAVRLGTLGHVSVLRRLSVEPFDEAGMVSLDSVEAQCANGGGVSLLPIDLPLAHLPAVTLDAARARRLLQGQPVAASPNGTAPALARVRLYDEAGKLLGIGMTDGSGMIRPRRLLNMD